MYLEKFCHGTLLSEVTIAVDDGSLLLTPLIVDTNNTNGQALSIRFATVFATNVLV